MRPRRFWATSTKAKRLSAKEIRIKAVALASPISTDPAFIDGIVEAARSYEMHYSCQYFLSAETRAMLSREARGIREAMKEIDAQAYAWEKLLNIRERAEPQDRSVVRDGETVPEGWAKVHALRAALPPLMERAEAAEANVQKIPKTKPRKDFRRWAACDVIQSLRAIGIKPTAHASEHGGSSTAVNLLVAIAQAVGDSELTRESARKVLQAELKRRALKR